MSAAVFPYLPYLALLISVAAFWVGLSQKSINRANREDKLLADVTSLKTSLLTAHYEIRSILNRINANTEILRIEARRLKDGTSKQELGAEIKKLLSVGQDAHPFIQAAQRALGALHETGAANRATFNGLQDLSVTAQRIKLALQDAESMSVQTLTLLRETLERQ